jgi:hypothetical protein
MGAWAYLTRLSNVRPGGVRPDGERGEKAANMVAVEAAIEPDVNLTRSAKRRLFALTAEGPF